ncbi:hypothetical protein [Nonlabens xiamenensis]|uniref:hypothetical protein n=1 Tax=Nonlabens xiamenensis TaxID=2341043 RepID=UPI000F611622|nr:hypothetical protein [Nonlabens xiamenensis]
MKSINLNEEVAAKIKIHYQEEYAKTLKKLDELKSILQEMEAVPTNNYMHESSESTTAITSSSEENESPKPKRKYKKKRGKKPVWSKFILNRLKATQTPLSYDDMTNQAIARMNLSPTDFENTRKKIVAAAFILRKKKGQIDTYAIKGDRTKYMGLTKWFEKEGRLNPEFQSKIVSQ